MCLDLESYLIRLLRRRWQVQGREPQRGHHRRRLLRPRPIPGDVRRDLRAAPRSGNVHSQTSPRSRTATCSSSRHSRRSTRAGRRHGGHPRGAVRDLEHGGRSTIVVQGDPGTGKTIVGVFLMKLLRDIQRLRTPTTVPNQIRSSPTSSWRATLTCFGTSGSASSCLSSRCGSRSRRCSRRPPGLRRHLVLTPFDVGASDEDFDLLVVDETHRLNQRANQPTGVLNKKFRKSTPSCTAMTTSPRRSSTGSDSKSRHQSLPPRREPRAFGPPTFPHACSIRSCRTRRRRSVSTRWLRRCVWRAAPTTSTTSDGCSEPRRLEPRNFPGYDLRVFDDLGEMQRQHPREGSRTRARASGRRLCVAVEESEGCLEIRHRARRRRVAVEQHRSRLDQFTRVDRRGRFDPHSAGLRPELRRRHHRSGPPLRPHPTPLHRPRLVPRHEGQGEQPALGIVYSDDDLLQFIRNIYGVLLTRGMRGTYVYVCDPALRRYIESALTR